ncbi:NADP-dependent oxidoreductase [Actinomycetospora termitidis]|uniref:NADP-dependent oxidoreductase n=1 Tax=Actinomycetospora termitidis TaxID=3053470 RepID=A0ABT7M7R1_9PSEU|nr:NADP-dependent oxidoreductase [Actinomycetospora sp. Odt1-22]MDL5156603.1 NADP-dependent oxidoreductase [Actinomycetospora sp. Odt1-22]
MRAVGVTEFGGPEALEIVELPEPEAGPGEVVVDVAAAAVSPTDTFTRNGARAKVLAKDPPPYVPGMDVAGTVAALGEETGGSGLAVGDRVMGIVVPGGSRGGYSSRIALPSDSVAHAPAGTDHAAASTLPMNGLTARLALDELALPAGATLAVTGAAGAFGGYVVQLAKADGLRVVADSSEADEELVRGLGADVLVRRGDDVADRIRAAVPEGVAGIADGSLQGDALVPALADGGRIATVRGYGGPEGGSGRGITWHPVWVRDYARNRAALDRLREQAESGVVTLRVADTVPAERAAETHRRLEAGGVRGRLVITF